jgi:quercetin dioxygenase-like cupin family protein
VQIDRSSSAIPTGKGPVEWFTGDVWIDPVAAPAGPSRMLASLVHFAPGARTAWHRHPLGQTLYVTEGIGLIGRRGAPPETIRPGDRVRIEPDEDHWHGACADRLMVHLALNETDDDHPAAHWGDHVTDTDYAAT